MKPKPEAILTKRALDYACSFDDYADEKIAELKPYASKKRNVCLQAAIVVAALIQLERRDGADGRAARHQGVCRSYAPAVQHRPLAVIQDLCAKLLSVESPPWKADEIPSLAPAAGAGDKDLIAALGAWLARTVTNKPTLGPAEQKIASAMGRSAWTSATMIVRRLPKSGARAP